MAEVKRNVMIEIWKEIPETKGLYSISSIGRIRSNPRQTTHSDGKVTNHKGRILKTALTKKGYERARISFFGNKKSYMIHRLVAKLFLVNPKKLEAVNHIDGNKQNNRSTNLEWISNEDNIKHAWENGLCEKVARKGSNNGIAKLTEKKVLEIRKKYIPNVVTRKDLAEEYNVTISCIKDILIRRSWKHI